jgi:hypothetical protein
LNPYKLLGKNPCQKPLKKMLENHQFQLYSGHPPEPLVRFEEKLFSDLRTPSDAYGRPRTAMKPMNSLAHHSALHSSQTYDRFSLSLREGWGEGKGAMHQSERPQPLLLHGDAIAMCSCTATLSDFPVDNRGCLGVNDTNYRTFRSVERVQNSLAL